MTLRLGCFRPTQLLTGVGDTPDVGAPLAGNGKNSGWREPLIGVSSDDRCSPGRNSGTHTNGPAIEEEPPCDAN